MKSIKGKLHYNGPGKLEDRDGKGSCTLYVNYRKKCQLQTPTEESSTREDHQFQAPKGKDGHCISYKKSTTPQLRQFLQWMDFPSKQSLPISSNNIPFPFFVGGLAYGFAIACMPQIIVLYYS